MLWGLKLKILKFYMQCWYKACINLWLYLFIIIGVTIESSTFQHFFCPRSEGHKNSYQYNYSPWQEFLMGQRERDKSNLVKGPWWFWHWPSWNSGQCLPALLSWCPCSSKFTRLLFIDEYLSNIIQNKIIILLYPPYIPEYLSPSDNVFIQLPNTH